jgi:predicted N-acetyltransferase YhbS
MDGYLERLAEWSIAVAVEYTIRRAAPQDATGILACLRSAFAPFESDYTSAGYEDTVLSSETLLKRLDAMLLFVAVDESGKVIGTIGCARESHGDGHLRGMAVLPELQGTRLARELLERAESALRDRGCRRVTLDTTVPLRRAIRFYERNGYKATGKVTDFFGMPLYEYAKAL